ncbi:MAG: tRNA uridine-5-carboxymethylaminomethyl(34) synthesis GTPase MnmE [Ktedonobacterales bacterium]|nr:tRNA uridine-5-carboxymethylaminomethyl(34) synthesis GTPase MnmE [Ktedonobacterales bacterium]
MNLSTEDTIVAIATPPGQGGVGIVRLSGPQAWPLAQRLFRRRATGSLRPQRLYYGDICDPATNEVWDDGLLAVMRAPNSYTGDDVAEINAHGAPIILGRIVGAALALGARAAEPGEMTLRAFLHGKLDLAQAEGVADLISANSAAAARQAHNQLAGHLSARVRKARDGTLRALAQIDASIDFPEEEVPTPDHASLAADIRAVEDEVADLLASAARGRITREGVRCVIAGRPNVGKSSLLNALLRSERAIVTPIAGTTRDTVEESALIGGVAFHLIDTAGITATDDPIEALGIARSRAAIAAADLALLVLDRSMPLTPSDQQIAQELHDVGFGQERPLVVVTNKSDLPKEWEQTAVHHLLTTAGISAPSSPNGHDALPTSLHDTCEISTVTGEALHTLEAMMLEATVGSAGPDSAALVARARHRDALRSAGEALAAAQSTLRDRLPVDLVAEDLRDALHALGLITGETITEDLLSSIFSEFCIGK